MVEYKCKICDCIYKYNDESYKIRDSDFNLFSVCKDCYYDKLKLTDEYYFNSICNGNDGIIYHTAFFFKTEKETFEYMSIFKNKYDCCFIIYISDNDGITNVFLVDSLDCTKYKKIGTCNIKFKKFIES